MLSAVSNLITTQLNFDKAILYYANHEQICHTGNRHLDWFVFFHSSSSFNSVYTTPINSPLDNPRKRMRHNNMTQA